MKGKKRESERRSSSLENWEDRRTIERSSGERRAKRVFLKKKGKKGDREGLSILKDDGKINAQNREGTSHDERNEKVTQWEKRRMLPA